MSKNYVGYGVFGIGLGLVLGFLVANWTAGSVQEAAVGRRDEAASVNGGGAKPELPPGHPDIGGGAAGAAASGQGATQLPPGHPDVKSAPSADRQPSTAQMAASSPDELPSLDPLPTGSKDERVEQKYKNIQILKGLPSDRLMNVMLSFKSSLGVDCTFCHVKDQWEKDDKQNKQIARKMIQLTRDSNTRLGGIGKVSCFTCHRGNTRPAF
jgi:hypothetical protein